MTTQKNKWFTRATLAGVGGLVLFAGYTAATLVGPRSDEKPPALAEAQQASLEQRAKAQTRPQGVESATQEASEVGLSSYQKTKDDATGGIDIIATLSDHPQVRTIESPSTITVDGSAVDFGQNAPQHSYVPRFAIAMPGIFSDETTANHIRAVRREPLFDVQKNYAKLEELFDATYQNPQFAAAWAEALFESESEASQYALRELKENKLWELHRVVPRAADWYESQARNAPENDMRLLYRERAKDIRERGNEKLK